MTEVLASPNVAYLLFMLGLIGIAIELHSPGVIIPGTIGAIALVLAFVGFAGLPLSWAGLTLVGIGTGLFIAELYTPGLGLLVLGGAVAFALGSLFLFDAGGAGEPPVRVSRWLVAVATVAVSSVFLVAARAVLRARRGPVATGSETLIGRSGVATSELAPVGRVRVDGETWTALAEGEVVRPGEQVVVIGVEGVTLHVTGEAIDRRT
jgi:membrane-bound serine protease (ClpP class)